MKFNNVRKPSLILMFFITITMLSGCSFHVSFNELKQEDAQEYVVEKKAVEPIKSIDIDTHSANIELIEADNYYVEIHYYYWDEAPEYKSEAGLISFDDSKVYPTSYSINFDMNNYVKIYLPKDAPLDKINIETSSGDATIAEFLADSLDVKLAYGDLSIENASAKKATIKMSSGIGDINNFNVQDLEIDDSYGDINLSDINTSEVPQNINVNQANLDMSLSSGHCVITSLIGNSLVIKDSYGNITCKGLTMGEFNSDLSSGNLLVTESVVDQMDISDSYGDTSLSLVGKEDDYKLDLSTDYGKIEVGNTSYEKGLVQDNGGSKSIMADLDSGNIKLEFK